MKDLTTESTEITKRESAAMDVMTDRVQQDLAGLLKRTHKKRGALSSDMAALGVITEEYHEVIEAMRGKEAWKVRAELLDLANGCIRRVLAIDAGSASNAEVPSPTSCCPPGADRVRVAPVVGSSIPEGVAP